MSVNATKDIVHKAMSDESFLNRLRTEPEATLDEFDLEEEERQALLGGTERKIREYLGGAETMSVAVVVWVSGN